MTKNLTPLAVKAAKPPKAGRIIKRDGIVPGMRFIVHAGGKKSYRILARIHGTQVNLSIGDASVLTLSEARDRGKDILAAIARGEDPRVTKRGNQNGVGNRRGSGEEVYRALRQGEQ